MTRLSTFIMSVSQQQWLKLVLDKLSQNVRYYDLRGKYIGPVAVIGFPLFYFIWHDLYPQPYENLTLRLIGSLLSIPIAFSSHWPSWANKLKTVYWNAVILYTLPFFFIFMLLQNGGSNVWTQSLLIAVFVMVIMLNWLSLLVHSVLGASLAWFTYELSTPATSIAMQHWEFIPIVIFAIVIGIATNYSTELLHTERERAMLDTAGTVAHELRTPLLGIKAGAAGLLLQLPALLETYRMAQEQHLAVPPIRTAHLNAMEGVLTRIETETMYANTMIDMLLVSTMRAQTHTTKTKELCSMATCITQALQRYPFGTGEATLVQRQPGEDFSFYASELQIIHVLFNLLKNALRHIQQAGKGNITITTETTPTIGRMVFCDTGTGIAPDVLPHIFSRFYTTQTRQNKTHNWGAGIGLAFCQDVIHSLGVAFSAPLSLDSTQSL